MRNNNYYQSIGRRKEAVARVRVFEGNSPILVNGKPISEVFKGELMQKYYLRPLELTKSIGRYTANVKVQGGGVSSRMVALTHGLARALAKMSQDNRAALKNAGLLTRDPRVKERRKYGLAHKARARKQSPKR